MNKRKILCLAIAICGAQGTLNEDAVLNEYSELMSCHDIFVQDMSATINNNNKD